MTKPPGKTVVLWGGGLGDALVLRPLLIELSSRGNPPVMASVASHAPELISAFNIGATSIILERNPMVALRMLRRIDPISSIYVGPYSTWKTRLLARTAAPRSTYVSHPTENRFIADAICDDVLSMGLAHTRPQPYGPLPIFAPPTGSLKPAQTILIHAGSRPDWPSKRWPNDRWAAVLRMLRDFSDCPILLVGTKQESQHLTELVEEVGGDTVRLETSLSLHELELRVAAATMVICHNSGIMHLALAHRKPTVVITGASARYWQAPYPWVTNLTSGTCALACNQRRCPVPRFATKCINDLTIEQVLDAINCTIRIS